MRENRKLENEFKENNFVSFYWSLLNLKIWDWNFNSKSIFSSYTKWFNFVSKQVVIPVHTKNEAQAIR